MARGRGKPQLPPKSNRDPEPVAPAPVPVRPLKPRPVLLAVMSVVFALWMAFLVVLYFKTIHPRRSTAPSSGLSLLDATATRAICVGQRYCVPHD